MRCDTPNCTAEITKGHFCKKCNNAIWYQKNKEHRKQKNADYRLNPATGNKVKLLIKKWYSNNGTEYHKNYRKDKMPLIAARKRNRYSNDVQFLLKERLRSRLYQALKRRQKVGSAVDDLGCSVAKLKIKLQLKFHRHPATGEYMTWDNYGIGGWEIDHIIPLASFDLTDREQFLKANHFTNLQPLWVTDNRKKSNK